MHITSHPHNSLSHTRYISTCGIAPACTCTQPRAAMHIQPAKRSMLDPTTHTHTHMHTRSHHTHMLTHRVTWGAHCVTCRTWCASWTLTQQACARASHSWRPPCEDGRWTWHACRNNWMLERHVNCVHLCPHIRLRTHELQQIKDHHPVFPTVCPGPSACPTVCPGPPACPTVCPGPPACPTICPGSPACPTGCPGPPACPTASSVSSTISQTWSAPTPLSGVGAGGGRGEGTA